MTTRLATRPKPVRPAHVPRSAPEEAIQRAVVERLAWSARPGVAWTHMPAGEVRHPATAGRLKAMGVQAGWPDLLLVIDGRLHGLELKRPGGRVSPAQQAAHVALRAAGATIEVAYGLDEALDVLAEWGVFREQRPP